MVKQNVLYAIMEYYSAIKSNKIRIHATICVNLENSMLSERSLTQKPTYFIAISIQHCIRWP